MSKLKPANYTGVINLDEFTTLFSDVLDEDFCRTMVKSCVFRLAEMQHRSGVLLLSFSSEANLYKKEMSLEWSFKITRQAQNTFRDQNRTTDFAAMCLAMRLSLFLTKYRYVIVAQNGTGIDFWLTNDETGEKFESKLEVSGIRKTTKTNTIPRRLKTKEKQVEKSAGYVNPAYIAVIEFSKPETIFVLYEDRSK